MQRFRACHKLAACGLRPTAASRRRGSATPRGRKGLQLGSALEYKSTPNSVVGGHAAVRGGVRRALQAQPVAGWDAGQRRQQAAGVPGGLAALPARAAAAAMFYLLFMRYLSVFNKQSQSDYVRSTCTRAVSALACSHAKISVRPALCDRHNTQAGLTIMCGSVQEGMSTMQ